MTNRELLELAAKAAGHKSRTDRQGILRIETESGLFRMWSPLSDNADAFALMVTLGLVVHVGSDAARALYDGEGCTEEYGGDKAASTRRAIVRAAAELGARK